MIMSQTKTLMVVSVVCAGAEDTIVLRTNEPAMNENDGKGRKLVGESLKCAGENAFSVGCCTCSK